MKRVLVVLIVVVGALVAGCGGGQSSADHRKEVAQKCDHAIGDFMSKVNEVGQVHLENTGLTFDEYEEHMGEMEQLDAELPDVGNLCKEDVVQPLEEAMASYGNAAIAWSNCVNSYWCTMGQIEYKVQREWDAADSSFHEADDALTALKRGELPSSTGMTAATLE